jgi:signal transduction histidine kinase
MTRYKDVLQEEGLDQLQRMQAAARRMQQMVEALLYLSRITTHARPFQLTDLNKIAAEVLEDLGLLIERTQGQVEVDELPTILADPDQMRQLFANLISNALKYHRPGVSPRVKVMVAHPSENKITRLSWGEYSSRPATLNEDEWVADKVLILFIDNGIGFDMKDLGKIFQPFQRLVGRSEYEGVGIGLAICRKIVERHGGHLTAYSQVGQGSTFMLTLPRQAADQVATDGSEHP